MKMNVDFEAIRSSVSWLTKLKFNGSSLLVASLKFSRHARPTRRHREDPREDVGVCVCRACRTTSPFSLPRACVTGRPAVCCGVGLYCCPFLCVQCLSPNSTSPTSTALLGHSHEDVANMSRGNRACRTCRTRMLRGISRENCFR